jgi:aldose 1-epimerase
MMTNARYSAVRSVSAVDLADRDAKVEVRILPGLGNRAGAMKVMSHDILWFPLDDGTPVAGKPALYGIPFLAPWGNRLDGGFHANGSWHPLGSTDAAAGPGAELRRDANGLPIHGLLYASPLWEVVDLSAYEQCASVTSPLNFGAHPELLARWRYRHVYDMTYRLADGALEVATVIRNSGNEPMPISIGFHPYFVLPGVPRDNASVRLPARSHVETDARLLATGALTPNNLPELVPLNAHALDDGFTDLIPQPDGRVKFSITGGGRSIDIEFGPRYTVAIVYSPPGRDFVCVEPMTVVTNGINLAAEGKYDGLQMLEPGAEWSESFWISTQGF